MPTSSPDASPLAAKPLPPTAPALLDADGRIATDVPCLCGYNLRTLAASGRCPECGAPVDKALRRGEEEAAEWVSRAMGVLLYLRFLAVVHAGWGLGMLIISCLGPNTGADLEIPLVVIGSIVVMCTVVALVISGRLTSPITSERVTRWRFNARFVAWVLHACILYGLVPGTIALCLAADGSAVGREALLVWALFTGGCAVLLPAALAWHLSEILTTLGAGQSARLVKRVCFGLAALYPVAALLAFEGQLELDEPTPAAITFLGASICAFFGLHSATVAVRKRVRRPRPRRIHSAR